MAQQAIYEQMVFPTRFVWAHGGKQVRPARIATFVAFPNAGLINHPRRWPPRPADPPVPSSGSDIPPPRYPPPRRRRCTCAARSRTGWRPSRWRPSRTPGGAQVFAVVCNLPPGYHQYKFIVGWRVAPRREPGVHPGPARERQQLAVRQEAGVSERSGARRDAAAGHSHSAAFPAAGAEEARATRERGDFRADPVAARKTARAPGWTGWTYGAKCRSSATWTGF